MIELEKVIGGERPFAELKVPRQRVSIPNPDDPLEPNLGAGETTFSPVRKGILAGSFNPLHLGHLTMANFAATRYGLQVWFELSVENVAKDKLTVGDLTKRAGQDFADHGLVVTTAPTFQQKAQLFPGADFLVGVDTIVRIGDARFYESEKRQRFFFDELRDHGSRFIVFGRKIDRRFCSSEIALSDNLRAICCFVEQAKFDVNISSTDLRARGLGID